MLQDPPRLLLQRQPRANVGGTVSGGICGVQTHAEHSWERTWFNALERLNFSHYFKQRSIIGSSGIFRVQDTSLFSFSLCLLLDFERNYSLWFRLKFLSLQSPLLPPKKGKPWTVQLPASLFWAILRTDSRAPAWPGLEESSSLHHRPGTFTKDSWDLQRLRNKQITAHEDRNTFVFAGTGETAADNKSVRFFFCEKDRSHFSTEYRR